MKKISDMNMNELSVAICKLAGPAEKLFSDGAVCAAFDEMSKRMGDGQTVHKAFSMFTAVLFPVLMNEEHKKDTCEIMAVMTDGDAKTIMESNGLETMRDMFRVFVVDGDVNAIFRPNAEIRGE